jgi:5-methylcytosine-specific restriction protein A
MSRRLPEWIGKTDDTPIPNRVRMRLIQEKNWKCWKCNRFLLPSINTRFHIDHRIALINGGENRESNLQALCTECHMIKTAIDVKAKAKTYRIHKRKAGIKKKGRTFATNKTGKFKRKMDGTIVRR